jgi:hypothetical protein
VPELHRHRPRKQIGSLKNGFYARVVPVLENLINDITAIEGIGFAIEVLLSFVNEQPAIIFRNSRAYSSTQLASKLFELAAAGVNMNWFVKMQGLFAGLFLFLVLTSCGGKVTTTSPPPQADFSLAATPASVTLVAGQAGQTISVSAVAANGFTGTVAVTVNGLPSGVTAQPATLTLTPGTAQNLSIVAASSAAAGTFEITLSGTSGTLTHTSTVTATISSPSSPDFTLTVSPSAVTLVPGAAGSPVSVMANALNGFANPVAVTITGLPTGVTATPATLALTPGTAQATTLAASSAAVAGTSTGTFTGTSGTLTHAATLALTVQSGQQMTNAPDVTTYHYDVARDGLNSQETILTPNNVNSAQFGKIGFYAVDGKVDAEPLFLANVVVNGAQHNVLYVETEHGSVYAFDADSGAQLWMVSTIPSGESTSDNHGCNQITPEIGITATPVIDRSQGPNGTIFVVAMSKDSGGAYHQRLHAFDITTGAEINGSPTEIAASVPGTGDNSQNGNVVFDPGQYAERAALLLLNGNIYTGWTSHCDDGLYTGWIMAYSETTLQQTQLLNLTPNGSQGSIWMGGDGLAADSNGYIYLLDANGTFDTTFDANGFPSQHDFGNAMLKLSTTGTLAVADYFETFNTVSESSDDLDLGSGGEVLLPDLTDASGTVHQLIVGAGKDRNIYLADRSNLGKFNSASNPEDSNIYQMVPTALGGLNFSTPAYFNGTLYFGADGDTLRAFQLTNAMLATSPTSQSAALFAHPGATPAVSANGTQNGIVWALESGQSKAAVLHAYDPTNLGHEYYNSNQAANARDSFGNGNKFITPMVVNGKVYVGTQTGVAVFGLLSN